MKITNVMYSRLYTGHLFVPSLLLGISFYSCTKKDFQPPQSENAAATATEISAAIAAAPNLIYQESLEASTYFPTTGSAINTVYLYGIENCNDNSIAHGDSYDWTLNRTTNPVFQNAKAVRFEVRKGQPKVGTAARTRSEVTVIRGYDDDRFTKDIWYSFAVLFPSTGFEYDKERDVINQWFEDGGDETTLKCDKNTAYLELCPAVGSSILKRYDLFSTLSANGYSEAFSQIPKNKWHEFVFHFIHSKSSDGLIEIWRDGIKIHHIAGRNMHVRYPKWKVGIYKHSFDDNTSLASSRVIYFDNIKIGKQGSTFADMTSNQPPPSNNVKPDANAGADFKISLPDNIAYLSGSATDDGSVVAKTWTKVSGPDGVSFSATNILNPSVSNLKTGTYVFRLTATDDNGATDTDDITLTVVSLPTSGIIGSFSLINADKDKGLIMMTNGATYSLSKLGLKATNIRANQGPGITKVKFVLSGKQSKSFTDDKTPFALMSDDGNGNYWYGGWNPPPPGTYTLTATPYLSGIAGPPSTITFTFVQ